MSFRGYFPAMGNFHGALVFACSWTPNNTSAPTNPLGSRFSVARTGVGTYVVTMQDKYPALIAAFPDITADVPVTSTGKLVSANVSSYNQAAKQVTVTLVDNTGAAVDVPATNNASVTLVCLFKNSVAKN